MRMISLSRMLGFHSGDAPGYQVCSRCGSSCHRYATKKPCDHAGTWRSGIYVADTVEPKSLDSQFPALVDSMRRYGMTTPIRVGGSKYDPPTVWNGHHRIAAAFVLGWEQILITSDWDECTRATRRTERLTGWYEGASEHGY